MSKRLYLGPSEVVVPTFKNQQEEALVSAEHSLTLKSAQALKTMTQAGDVYEVSLIAQHSPTF